MNIFKTITTGVVAIALGTTVFGNDPDDTATANFEITAATALAVSEASVDLTLASVTTAGSAGMTAVTGDLTVSFSTNEDAQSITAAIGGDPFATTNIVDVYIDAIPSGTGAASSYVGAGNKTALNSATPVTLLSSITETSGSFTLTIDLETDVTLGDQVSEAETITITIG